MFNHCAISHKQGGFKDKKFDSLFKEELYPPDTVRVFHALFDYDPYTMSPNPDAVHEELAFKVILLTIVSPSQTPN